MSFVNRIRTRLLLVVMLLGVVPRAASAVSPTSRDLIQEATIAADKITDADQKARTQLDIATAQARSGDVAGAKRTAKTIQHDMFRGSAYGVIATTLARAGDMDGAQAILDGITDKNARAQILESLAEVRAAKGDLAGAKAAAQNVDSPFLAAQAGRSIALAEARAGDLDAAKEEIGRIRVTDVKVEGYLALAVLKAKAGDKAASQQMMDLATECAKSVAGFAKPMADAELAACEVKLGDMPGAMRLADATTKPMDKAMILRRIATAQIEMDDIAGARKTVASLSDASAKMNVELDVADALDKRGDKDGAHAAMKKAMALVDPASLSSFDAELIAKVQARLGDGEAAAAWGRAQQDPQVRASALLGVVQGLPEYQRPDAR